MQTLKQKSKNLTPKTEGVEDLTLVLDSTSTPLVIALFYKGKIYALSKDGIKQEEILFPLINRLFKKIGKNFKDTKNFFFVKGPGRFTGIRIGITLASILAEINNTKIASANIFDILSQDLLISSDYQKFMAKNNDGKGVIILPAFRQEYFMQMLDGSAPLWLNYDELLLKLKQQKVPLFLCGWGADRQPLKKFFGTNYTYAKNNFLTPENLLNSATKYLGTQTREEVLTPLYLKPARFELCGK